MTVPRPLLLPAVLAACACAPAAEDLLAETFTVSEARLRLGSTPGIQSVKTERKFEIDTGTGPLVLTQYTRTDSADAKPGFNGSLDLVFGELDPASGGTLYGASIDHYQRQFVIGYDPVRADTPALSTGPRASSERLGMQSYGGSLFAGYAFPYSDTMRLEVAAFAGLGYIQVDHDVIDVNASTEPIVRSGNGFYYQAGARADLSWTFEEWSIGLGGEYNIGRATSKWHNYGSAGQRLFDNVGYRWSGVGVFGFVGTRF